MSDDFTIKTGSDNDLLFYQFDPIINLTGVLSVLFSMKKQQATTIKINDAVAQVANGTYIIDGVSTTLTPTDGVVFYPWTLVDLDTAGNYEGEFKVTFANGKSSVNPSYGRKNIIISDSI